MKILILIPCMEFLDKPFVQSLLNIDWPEGCQHEVKMSGSTLVHVARERLGEHAIYYSDADYVLWFDSDMVFEPDIVKRMLESIEGKDFLSALYFNRRPPFSPVISTDLKMDMDGFITATPVISYKKEIMEIRGCGFGCVMMTRKILQDVKERYKSMFAMLSNGIVGEDYSFCAKALMCGYKLYCDTRITLGHMTDTKVTEDTYKGFNPKVNNLFPKNQVNTLRS